MRDVATELKALRLYGRVSAWEELLAQGTSAAMDSSRWLVEHLLDEEQTNRSMRSIRYQMHAAKFPVHRDLAGFASAWCMWFSSEKRRTALRSIVSS